MNTSAGGTSRVRDRISGLMLHRAVAKGMQEHPELTMSAGGAPEVRLVGLDPIRVLVIGSGLAVGYGVRTHAEALTGGLAEAVQAGRNRGVIVQNRASGSYRIEQTVADLGEVGATAFNLVVWCPSLLDILRRPDHGSYNQVLLEGLRVLRKTARPGAEIILCALPLPTRRGPIEELARTVVPRFNRALARTVAPMPNVRVAEAPPFTSLMDPAALSRDYYRRMAEQIVHPEAGAVSRSA